MEGPSLRADHWLSVARHLSVRELCRCMQVSRAWFYMWVADRMWAQHRRRICAGNPELVRLFEEHSDASGDGGEHESKRSRKSNSNAKRKTPWIMPKQGTWYVFRRWLSKGMSAQELRKLPRHQWESSAVLASLVRSHLPDPQGWSNFQIHYNVVPPGRRYPSVFYIEGWYKIAGLDSPGHRIRCLLNHGAPLFFWEYCDAMDGLVWWAWQMFRGDHDFAEWRAWILWPTQPRDYTGPGWTSDLVARFEGEERASTTTRK